MKPKRALPIVGQLADSSITDAGERGVRAMLLEAFDAVEAGDQVFVWFEDVLAQVKARTPPARPLACTSGCAYCCHLKVTITPLEALRLGSLLRKQLPAAELGRLKKRVTAAAQATRGLDTAQRARLRLPCVLLDEAQRCIAYEARPSACAAANSFDAERCKAAHESDDELSIENYGLAQRVANALTAGASNGIFASGRDGRILELFAALRVVLADPEARAKWQRGLPVFESAVDRELAELAQK